MDQITRRNLLKSLAAAPLLSALHPVEVTPQGRPAPELCLWFHGLFAFVIMDDYIAVLTPRVEEHQYLAGLWKKEQKLRAGEWYRLSGVSDVTRPTRLPVITKDKMLMLSGVKVVNMADSFCLFRLPFPTQILPLRYAPAQFSGDDAPEQNTSSTFPTVQIMRYRVVDYRNLRLEPFKAWVTQKRPPAIINFHIFAEPAFMVQPQHATEAFDEMVQLFRGIDLKLASTTTSCLALDRNLPPGLNPDHQISLAERNGECKNQSGSRPANCFMIILDARKSA